MTKDEFINSWNKNHPERKQSYEGISEIKWEVIHSFYNSNMLDSILNNAKTHGIHRHDLFVKWLNMNEDKVLNAYLERQKHYFEIETSLRNQIAALKLQLDLLPKE